MRTTQGTLLAAWKLKAESALLEVIGTLITIDAQDEDYGRMRFIRVNRNAGHKIANGEEYHEICTIVGHRHDHHGEL